MSNETRTRINAAFDDELSAAPVPAGLRALSIRDAVAAPRRRAVQPQLMVIVATVVVIAVVVSFVIGSHLLRSTPLPAKPVGSIIPPPARASAAAAFDQAHGVMVIFGGNAANGKPATNETWTWDGKYWFQQRPALSPTPRQNAAMAYDSVHSDVVLFGGQEYTAASGKGGLTTVDDTWIWNGFKWRQAHPAHSPSFGFDYPADMAFDPISRRVLLYGLTRSTNEANVGVTSETWAWTGSDWTQLFPSESPTTPGVMVVHDSQLLGSDLLLLAPSPGLVKGRFITQTWGWSGSTWTPLDLSVDLPPGGFLTAAGGAAGAVIVTTGGDTWSFNGSGWSRAHPSFQPPATGYMAYVPSLKRFVSWGDKYLSDDNQMYAWDGTDWSVFEPGTVAAAGRNGKGGVTTRMTPEQAAALVRSTVKNTRPVLLPASLPVAGGPWDSFVQVTADDFNLTSESDQRDKIITICICGANPPPAAGPNASDTRVRFRNAAALKYGTPGYAEYVVYDTTAPTSQRYLMWLEPGSATNNMDYNGGVYYFLSATGLTDQEFWQVANSLQ